MFDQVKIIQTSDKSLFNKIYQLSEKFLHISFLGNLKTLYIRKAVILLNTSKDSKILKDLAKITILILFSPTLIPIVIIITAVVVRTIGRNKIKKQTEEILLSDFNTTYSEENVFKKLDETYKELL